MRGPLTIGNDEVMTPGLRAIIFYKLGKGALQIIACAVLAILLAAGLDRELAGLDAALREHFTSGWSARIAAFVVRHLNGKVLRFGALALGADGVLSLGEGWALHRRHWWGPWVVVVASGSLLPFELYEIGKHARIGRILLFAVNAVIVAYLARRALLEHRERVRVRAEAA
jgi:uncharacterized membrane protein (DUF2068 family)